MGVPTLHRAGCAGHGRHGGGAPAMCGRPLMSALNFWSFSFKRKGQETSSHLPAQKPMQLPCIPISQSYVLFSILCLHHPRRHANCRAFSGNGSCDHSTCTNNGIFTNGQLRPDLREIHTRPITERETTAKAWIRLLG